MTEPVRLTNLLHTVFTLAISLLLLTGCATLSRDQCRQGDWFGIGYSDGLAGLPASRADEHFRACAEYGIMLNDQQYLEGRVRGLNEYCRLDNAVSSGLAGRLYQRVCPVEIDAEFARYNQAAYRVYRVQRDIEATEARMDELEFRLRARDISYEYRRELRRELRELDHRYAWLRHVRIESEHELDLLINQLHRQPPDPTDRR